MASHTSHNLLQSIGDRIADIERYQPYWAFIELALKQVVAIHESVIKHGHTGYDDQQLSDLKKNFESLQLKLGAGSQLGNAWPALIKRLDRLQSSLAHHTDVELIKALEHQQELLEQTQHMAEDVCRQLVRKFHDVTSQMEHNTDKQNECLSRLTLTDEALPNSWDQVLSPYLLQDQILQPALLMARCLQAVGEQVSPEGEPVASALLQVAHQQVERYIKALHKIWLNERQGACTIVTNPNSHVDDKSAKQERFWEAVMNSPFRGAAFRALHHQKTMLTQLEMSLANTLGDLRLVQHDCHGGFLQDDSELDKFLQDEACLRVAANHGDVNAGLRESLYQLQQHNVQLQKEKNRLETQWKHHEKRMLDARKSLLFIHNEQMKIKSMQGSQKELLNKTQSLKKAQESFVELGRVLCRLDVLVAERSKQHVEKGREIEGCDWVSPSLSKEQQHDFYQLLQSFAQGRSKIIDEFQRFQKIDKLKIKDDASLFEIEQLYQTKLMQEEKRLKTQHKKAMENLGNAGIDFDVWLADFSDLTKPFEVDVAKK